MTDLKPTDCALSLDINVRSGTANVLAQRQFLRTMYSGDAIGTAQVCLEAGQTHEDPGSYSVYTLLTDTPVAVTMDTTDGARITIVVNKILIIDNTVSNIVITNTGSGTAILSISKLS